MGDRLPEKPNFHHGLRDRDDIKHKKEQVSSRSTQKQLENAIASPPRYHRRAKTITPEGSCKDKTAVLLAKFINQSNGKLAFYLKDNPTYNCVKSIPSRQKSLDSSIPRNCSPRPCRQRSRRQDSPTRQEAIIDEEADKKEDALIDQFVTWLVPAPAPPRIEPESSAALRSRLPKRPKPSYSMIVEACPEEENGSCSPERHIVRSVLPVRLICQNVPQRGEEIKEEVRVDKPSTTGNKQPSTQKRRRRKKISIKITQTRPQQAARWNKDKTEVKKSEYHIRAALVVVKSKGILKATKLPRGYRLK